MDALAGYESDESESTDTNSVHSISEKHKNLLAAATEEEETDFINGGGAPTSKSPSAKPLSRLSMESETFEDDNETASKSEERELDCSLKAESTTREPPNGELNGDQAKTEDHAAVDHRSCLSGGGHTHNEHKRHRSRSRSRSKSGHHSSRSRSHSPVERNIKSRSRQSRSRDHSRSQSRDPKSRSHSRSPRRKHSSHHRYSEKKLGRGSDSRKSRVTESHRSSRRRRSGSRNRRRPSRSHSRERNKRRSRSRSHDRSSRRSKSRSRSRSRSRRGKRSRSRDYSSRHRSRSRSRDRNAKRQSSGSEIKTAVKLQPVEAAAVAAAAATEAVRKTMEGCGETTSKLPLNSNVISAGCQMTPQMAVQQAMAAVNAKAQQLTGIALPKYYNPAAVNPMKYAEQMQKRKLLWHCNKEKTHTLVAPASNNNWESTTFAQDQDGKMTAKFRKLMGIKSPNTSSEETIGITSPNPSSGPASEEQIRKQEEMFRKLDQQYEVARMSTHTHRGVGLGFTSQAHHLFPK